MRGAAGSIAGAEARQGNRDLRQLRRLGRYLRPYRWRLAATLVALMLAASSVLVLGVGLRYLIDGAFGDGRIGALDHALEAALIVIVVLAVATFARAYLVTWLGERVIADLRRDVYDHVIGLLARVLRADPHRRGALAPDLRCRRDPDRDQRQPVAGAAQHPAADRRPRPAGLDQPEAHRAGAGGRAAGGGADRGDRAQGAAALAPRPRTASASSARRPRRP